MEVLYEMDERTKNREKQYMVRCECGDERVVRGSYIRQERKHLCKKCSASKTLNATTHGLSKHGAYNTFKSMIARCENPSVEGYKSYGAKGVVVCDEWKNMESFFKWADSSGFKKGLSIERIDPYGNYEPDNCTWIPLSEQYLNKRELTAKNKTGIKGVSLSGRKNFPYLAKHDGIYIGRYKTIKDAEDAILLYKEQYL